MSERKKNLPDEDMVAVVLDMKLLRHVKEVARSDYRRIQTFAYAIADLTGAERHGGPAAAELATSLEVMQFIDTLTERAEAIWKAQRTPISF